MEPEKQTELESDEQGNASSQTFPSVSLEEAAVLLKDLKLSNEADRSKQCMGGARPKEKAGERKPGADVCKKYYGVSFPSAGLLKTGHLPLVYDNKVDAIRAIRLIPGARFKEFSSRREAHEYASFLNTSHKAISFRESDKQLLRRSIRCQEMLQLQKFIETGNEALFLELVWSNPRYLVSNSDGPTIVQGETRYNALHIAAKCGQTGMFIAILYMIQDHQFLSTLYPEDPPNATQSRIEHLVDMYLNMPDEAMSESPLHFACKFGHKSIVGIMLSYSQCNVKMKNKDGYCAKDLVCQNHACNSSDHKERMLAIFDDMFYVPLLQDSVHTFAGQPCNCSTVLVAATSHPHMEGNSVYCSFAGPASLSQATNFYTILKTKKFPEKSGGTETLAEMCLSDLKKGLQRAGRILCKDFSLGWLEYWSGLNCWLDICSPEGLEHLNKHLRKQDNLINLQQGEVTPFIHLIENFMDEFAEKIPGLVVKSRHLFFFHELQSLVEHMECFTKHSYSNEAEICDIHEEVGHMLYLRLTNDNHSNQENFQALKLFLLSPFGHTNYFQKLKWKMLSCILRFAFYFQSSSTDIIILFAKKPICNCDYSKVDESFIYSSKSCYYAVVSLRQELTNHLVQQYQTEPKEDVEKPKQTLVIPLRGLPFNFIVIRNDDGFLTPASLDSDASEFNALETMYFTLADGFHFNFRSLMVRYELGLPFARLKYFFDVMKNAMHYFKQICEVNYYEDCHLLFLHHEFAYCLAYKMLTLPRKTVIKWKAYIEDNSFTYQVADVAEHGMTSTREWMHLLCILKLFCFVLDGKTDLPMCICTYNTDRSQQSVHPVNCLVLLRRLRDLYVSAVRFINAENPSDTCSDTSEHFTPPESPDTAKEVFVGGEDMSDNDIDIFLALNDAQVFISRFQHPYIFKWKIWMEARLG